MKLGRGTGFGVIAILVGASACKPAPAEKVSPAETAAASAATAMESAATAAKGSCDAVVAHLDGIVKRDHGSATASWDPKESLAKCKSQGATAEHLACLAKADTVPDTAACDKAAFAGVDVPTRVTRELDALHLDRSQRPGTQDGDYLVFRDTGGRKCGFLMREHHFASAMFVMCGGAIISGPLTSAKDIEEVSKELSNRERKEHEMVMAIMANYPYGRKVDAYDAKTGAYVGKRY